MIDARVIIFPIHGKNYGTKIIVDKAISAIDRRKSLLQLSGRS